MWRTNGTTVVKAGAVCVGIGALVSFAHLYTQAPNQCADFSSHAAAQRWFQSHSATWLDHDADGIACERLR